MYQFPLIESKKDEVLLHEESIRALKIEGLEVVSKVSVHNTIPIVHKLSHQHLHTKFWIVETPSILSEGIAFSNLKDYPTSVLIDKFIRRFKF